MNKAMNAGFSKRKCAAQALVRFAAKLLSVGIACRTRASAPAWPRDDHLAWCSHAKKTPEIWTDRSAVRRCGTAGRTRTPGAEAGRSLVEGPAQAFKIG